jgi:hypothetical protein
MAKPTTQQQRLAHQLCPQCGGAREPDTRYACTACLDVSRLQYLAQLSPERQAALLALRQRRAAQDRATRPHIGCCGQWHAVTQLPLRVLCCGRVFFGES